MRRRRLLAARRNFTAGIRDDTRSAHDSTVDDLAGLDGGVPGAQRAFSYNNTPMPCLQYFERFDCLRWAIRHKEEDEEEEEG